MQAQCKEKVQKLLDKLQKYDIITDCNTYTPIISQLIVTLKKDKVNYRVILDCRAVNYFCLKQPVQMPSNYEIFNHFSKKHYVTSSDCAQGYFSIPIEESKRPLFAFFDTQGRRKMWKKNCPRVQELWSQYGTSNGKDARRVKKYN